MSAFRKLGARPLGGVVAGSLRPAGGFAWRTTGPAVYGLFRAGGWARGLEYSRDRPEFGFKHASFDPHRKPASPEALALMASADVITHTKPRGLQDKVALGLIRLIRMSFDTVTGYRRKLAADALRGHDWTTRIVILETVAGIPGICGATLRHLQSLRHMKRDRGLIHTLLEEAENERLHLLIALELRRRQSLFFRTMVILMQAGFLPFYMTAYTLSPSFCHRFVGYLEEEAVKTYHKLLTEIDKGKLPEFQRGAPPLALEYYRMPPTAKVRDVFVAMCADEAHHRATNHAIAREMCELLPAARPGRPPTAGQDAEPAPQAARPTPDA